MKTIATIDCFVAATVWLNALRPVPVFNTKKGTLKVTPIRHVGMLIEAGGKAVGSGANSR